MFIFAITIVFILPIMIFAKLGLAVLLLIALCYYGSLYAWLILSSSFVALRLEDDLATFYTRDSREFKGVVSQDSVVMSMLTILNVEQDKGKRILSMVIFPDSLDAEKYRELRVLLKWGCRRVL
jgi:toxin CptA